MKKYLFYLLILCTSSAIAKPILIIYTYDAFANDWGPGPIVKKNFEADCDCELQFVTLTDGVSLLNRLNIEGKNSNADVVLGLDNNLLQAAQETNLFSPSGIDTKKLNVPGGWLDKTFIPYDYGYFAFVYNKERVKNPPKSMQELVDHYQDLSIIYEDPRTSTSGLGMLLWMQKVFGEKASEAWQKIAKKTVTVTEGWSEAYSLFLKGEADLVLSYTTSPAYHLIKEKKDNYIAASFSEGHYLQIEVAGTLKTSKQPDLAKRFMQFLITPASQNYIPTGNWMYPVIDTPLPIGFEQMATVYTTLQYHADEVARHRDNWIRAWQIAVSS
ncbi:thiamine transporter substrate binding subunit [Serratia symbiotica str. 'Cinara cedri']|nr:thiamine transporter substrate binding subunit [Serratia symbiotica str. 'Cinara cedri']